jgi:arsenite transporter
VYPAVWLTCCIKWVAMGLTDKLQSIFILFSVAVGLALGQVPLAAEHAETLIVPFLMLMLVVVFLHIPLRDLNEAFHNVRFTSLSLGINFIWTPLLGWFLGFLFLQAHPDLWVGFLMLLVTPCTDWYLVFTQLARGNVRLAAALLPWHLVLQLLLLPVYLFIFAGALIPIEPGILVESVLLVLVIPFVTAGLLRVVVRRSKGSIWLEKTLLPKIAPMQLPFLCLAIAAMFASQGAALLEQPEVVLILLLPLLVFFIVNLALGLLIGRLARLDYEACTGLCFATLARNSPVSLAVAVTAFPDHPLIALALVIGPLIELPTMAVIAQILLSLQKRQQPLSFNS